MGVNNSWRGTISLSGLSSRNASKAIFAFSSALRFFSSHSLTLLFIQYQSNLSTVQFLGSSIINRLATLNRPGHARVFTPMYRVIGEKKKGFEVKKVNATLE